MNSFGMDAALVADILAGDVPDDAGLIWNFRGALACFYGGIGLLWLAAVLTFITGWDYLTKSMPFLREGSG